MPELPEVETVRAGLERHVLGRTVFAADVLHPRAVRRQEGGEPAFASRLVGARLAGAQRRGKYLWLTLDDPAAAETPAQHGEALLAHLGMSGQLLVRGAGAADAALAARGAGPGEDGAWTHPHLRVRLTLDDASELWFVDQRTFGHLMVTDLAPAADVPEDPAQAVPAPVAHIARDLLDPRLDLDALVSATRKRTTEIKRALLDQSLVSGIGNIYADEALWRAGIHGRRRTDKLTGPALRALYGAALDVMTEALAQGGTSFDALYVNVNGESGYFDRSLAAYGQAGRPCARCGTLVQREQFMNRSSFFCPRCQPAPRRRQA